MSSIVHQAPAIVAFSKDWDDVPTATTHVLRRMGRENPVLWINSVGCRKPSLTSGYDLGRYWRKGKAALNQRFILKENQLRVLSPCVIPRATAPWLRQFNRFSLGSAVRRQLRSLKSETVELWAFLPTVADYLGCFGEQKVVYYCVDDWSSMPGLDSAWAEDREAQLLAGASIVFATSKKLVEKCLARTRAPVHYMPHGVDHATFAAALDPQLPIPHDLAELPRPLIGFYGTIGPHIDFPLLAELARRRPAWTFCMIGPQRCDVSALSGLPNILLPGRREHHGLPAYCKGFDVAIIPYDVNHPLIEAVNPIKAREILAAGVPVVSSDFPEMREPLTGVRLARTPDEWIAALEEQLAEQDRPAISAAIRGSDWSEKLREIRRFVDASDQGGCS